MSLHELFHPLPGPAYAEPVCAEEQAMMRAYQPETLRSWALPWLHAVFLQDPVPKLAIGSLVGMLASFAGAIWLPVAYAWSAWACDFGVGIFRAIADPRMKISTEKARRGLAKMVMIPLVLILVGVIEAATAAMVGWDPAGKFVMGASAAFIWDCAASVQRNLVGYWDSVSLRFVSNVGWFGRGSGAGGGGGGGAPDVRTQVTEAERKAAEDQARVGEQLAAMSEREKEQPNGRSRGIAS